MKAPVSKSGESGFCFVDNVIVLVPAGFRCLQKLGIPGVRTLCAGLCPDAGGDSPFLAPVERVWRRSILVKVIELKSP
jgi:hypothetical protein